MVAMEAKSNTHVKNKHIVEIVKTSYDNHCDLLLVNHVSQLAFDYLPQFLKAYLAHVVPLLLEDIEYMNKRLVALEQQILEKPEKRDSNLILMLEITGVYDSNWGIVYFSLKELLEILVKTKKKKYE